MTDRLPTFTASEPSSQRRRLVIAIGTTLVAGVIAASVAHEHADESVASGDASPSASAPTLAAPQPPAARVASREAIDTRDDAAEALRTAVDEFVEARADALHRLDVARRAGVDPDVLAALGAVLGMPLDRPSSREPAPAPDEPRSL